ncbi:MAG: hypothetical protein HC832_00360 [Leptolyngbyaceae cyanobacterium RM1_405_57]|nr:hypothetical protein [Leptolyngbyaceae cyanobacterium RM1_405_57]
MFEAEVVEPQPSQFHSVAAQSTVQSYRQTNSSNLILSITPLLIVAGVLLGWLSVKAHLEGKVREAYQSGLAEGKTAGLTEGKTQATAELQPQVEQANQQAAAAEAAKVEAVAQKAVCDVSIAQIKSVLGVR